MKIIMVIISIVVCCNSQVLYKVPAGANNLRIDMAILNQSDYKMVNTNIDIIDAPSWLVFKNKQFIIKSIEPNQYVSQSIVFSSDGLVQQSRDGNIIIDIAYETGNKIRKTYFISIEPPYRFSLSQNYPNPFNPSTKIDYQIPSSEFVSLKVYDVIGKEVETLVNRSETMGAYSVVFDATHLPSGLYIYRLSAGGLLSVNKMLLLK